VSRDLKKSFVTSVEKAAKETDFYAVATADGRSQDVERLLSQIEDLGAPAIQAVTSGGFPPSTADREAVAMFIAFQFTRGRNHRDAWNMMTDYTTKLFIHGMTEDDARARLTAATGTAPSDKDVRSIVELGQNLDSWEVVPHPNEAIKAMLDNTPQLVPYIMERRWRLARFGKPLLLTSDSPVALWRRVHSSAYGIGIANADEIRFPLDPQHALILTLDGSEMVWDLHDRHAADLNRSVGAVGYEWIYRHPEYDALEELKLPPPRPPIHISGPLPKPSTDRDSK